MIAGVFKRHAHIRSNVQVQANTLHTFGTASSRKLMQLHVHQERTSVIFFFFLLATVDGGGLWISTKWIAHDLGEEPVVLTPPEIAVVNGSVSSVNNAYRERNLISSRNNSRNRHDWTKSTRYRLNDAYRQPSNFTVYNITATNNENCRKVLVSHLMEHEMKWMPFIWA